MIVAIAGGVGLFLLGMAVMTDGLKALAGSALRRVLARAAATPLRGAFWGATLTLIVQSSSATTMTTIGLVSAGLLNFPQGLSVIFGSAVGTTGTGWLVALLGVKVSLTPAALPMVFVGALLRLLGRGRWMGSGAALAGFGLLLFGLTTLQGGMGGLAELINPADLAAVVGAEGVDPWRGMAGLLVLVLVGVVITTLMQSSSAAIAISISALHAGAIGIEQTLALVIGQNVGTAVSSAMAAIGTTAPARRTAIGYILFKVVTATIAVAAFPLVTPWIVAAGRWVDPPTLIAAYHTAYNVVGVSILLPLIGPFSRFVERLVRPRGPSFTRHLDRSVLSVPAVAVEAARRSVAGVLAYLCGHIAAKIESRGNLASSGDELSEAIDALGQTRVFLSQVVDPPASEAEQGRLTGALHALDHAARLADAMMEEDPMPLAGGEREGEARVRATGILRMVEAVARPMSEPAPADPLTAPRPIGDPMAEIASKAAELADLRREHRRQTLELAARGGVNPADAMARVDLVRQLDRLAYHAWRSVVHLAEQPASPGGKAIGSPPALEKGLETAVAVNGRKSL